MRPGGAGSVTAMSEPVDRPRVAVDLAVRRIAVGYRVVGAVWIGVLGGVAVAGGARPAPVAGVVVAAAAWTVLTTALLGRPADLAGLPYLIGDLGVSAATIVVPALIGDGGYAGGYPFATVLHAAVLRGMPSGLAAGAVLSAATGAAAGRAPGVEVVLVYLLGAGVIAWAMGVLRAYEADREAAERALASERAERARSEERAETAAHLHDSVLQTLALLQRRADDAEAVTQLARAQERELRQWLYGDGAQARDARLQAALADVCAELEGRHRIAVELVTVGDAPLDEALEALVAATREAVTNAAVHGQVDGVSVYAEVTSDRAAVWIRDRGVGFDPDAVPEDRRGVRDSIVGRVRRRGGEATIRSSPDAGTEVALSVPRQAVR